MSGGFFDYQQYRLEDIAIEIEDLIDKNDTMDKDELDEDIGYHYPTEIIEKFKETVHTLRQASKMVHRIDYLVSGDDSENSFLIRWKSGKA